MVFPQLQRIVLTGFMGSGKTTIGRLLAARLGWSFADLDDVVTERCGLTVPDIFARFGEPHFRGEESLALAECLRRTDLVLALGGGAPENEANRTLLLGTPQCAVVYLEGKFPALHARCLRQAADPRAVARPVLADPEQAGKRFLQRVPFYRQIATHTVRVSDRSPESLAEALAQELGTWEIPETP